MLAFALASHSLALSATLMGSALLATSIGAISQYLFVWTVFRRDSRWARAVIWMAIALLLAGYVGDLVENGLVNRQQRRRLVLARRRDAHVGAGLERARIAPLPPDHAPPHAARPRGSRRDRELPALGPRRRARPSRARCSVSQRASLTGHGAAEFPILNLVLSLLGLVAAIAMWLAFLPTPAYLRFVESRGRRAGALPSAPG